MHVVKKWLNRQVTSLFLGVVLKGMVFSFKDPQRKPEEIVFHCKPIKLLEAIESLKTDKEKAFHRFSYEEPDLPGHLHVGGQLCFNFCNHDLVDLSVGYYFGYGAKSFHEFTVTMKLSDLDIIVQTINEFFVEK